MVILSRYREKRTLVMGAYQIEEHYRANRPWRTLFALARPDKWRLVVALTWFLIKHSPVWILPVTTANIINAVTGQPDNAMRLIFINAVIMLAFIAQNLPSNYLYARYFSQVRRAVEMRLRAALVRRMQQLSIGFHEGFHSGYMHAKVLRDVESIEMLFQQLVNAGLTASVGIVVTLGITVSREPMIALFFLIAAPLVAFLRQKFRRRMKETSAEFREQIEEMSSRVSEMIEMIPVTRAHGVEQFEIKKMNDQLAHVKDKGTNVDLVRGVFSAATWVVFQSTGLVCLVFAAILALRGVITVGDVVLFNSLFMLMIRDISNLLNIYPVLARGFESIRSMGEVLESPDLEHNHNKNPVASVKGAFDFQNVRFTYPEAVGPAIRDFNLRVEAGECLAFVGESGSGKTTLMNLVIGFRRPTGGAILLDTIDMEELDLRRYREYLSVVSQHTILFSASVRENVAYGMERVPDTQLWEALEMANATDFVERLPRGIDTIIGEHGAKLSGGQRQRIAIARAIIREPQVIIFDEATSSLDVVSEKQVQEAINQLIQGRTTFIVAHRLSTIRKADRIVVMKEGRCVECGAYETLMRKEGEFYRLHNLQNWAVKNNSV